MIFFTCNAFNPLYFQVIALCQAPFLLDDPNVGLLFPADAIAKAKHYLSLNSGGLGILSNLNYIILGPSESDDTLLSDLREVHSFV